MPHTRIIQNSLARKDNELGLVKDILDLIAEKGPISIYRLAKELQSMDKYKNVNWNAIRMRITRIVYRLSLAGMLKYERGPRNSKLLDLSYDYLHGKYGEIPEDILNKAKIDIKKYREQPIEETRRILQNINRKIKDPYLSNILKNEKLSNFEILIISKDSEELLRKVLEEIEPDLFSGWKELADKVKRYYYDALIKREVKRNPKLTVAYILANINVTDEEITDYILDTILDAFYEVYKKYCSTKECKESYNELLDKIINGARDFNKYTNNIDLLIGKVVIPRIFHSLSVDLIIDSAKALYIASNKVVKPHDIKEVFKKALLISKNPEYINALYETIKILLPYVDRKVKLAEAEANVYKGLEIALRELLMETRIQSQN